MRSAAHSQALEHSPILLLLLVFLRDKFTNALSEAGHHRSRKNQTRRHVDWGSAPRLAVEELVELEDHYLVQLIHTLLLLQLKGLQVGQDCFHMALYCLCLLLHPFQLPAYILQCFLLLYKRKSNEKALTHCLILQ